MSKGKVFSYSLQSLLLQQAVWNVSKDHHSNCQQDGDRQSSLGCGGGWSSFVMKRDFFVFVAAISLPTVSNSILNKIFVKVWTTLLKVGTLVFH